MTRTDFVAHRKIFAAPLTVSQVAKDRLSALIELSHSLNAHDISWSESEEKENLRISYRCEVNLSSEPEKTLGT